MHVLEFVEEHSGDLEILDLDQNIDRKPLSGQATASAVLADLLHLADGLSRQVLRPVKGESADGDEGGGGNADRTIQRGFGGGLDVGLDDGVGHCELLLVVVSHYRRRFLREFAGKKAL